MDRPRTKTRRAGLALFALSILAAITAVVPGLADSAPPTPIALPAHVPMAGADFPGAPPVFAVPPGGSIEVSDSPGPALEYTLIRADGVVFARALSDQSGAVIRATWFDDSGRPVTETTATYLSNGASRSLAQARAPLTTKRRATNCNSSAYGFITGQWASGTTFTWYFVAASTPSGVSIDTTETRLRSAHATWYNNTNVCGIADNSAVSIAYGGRTSSSFGNNGISTIGFGDVGAIGCTAPPGQTVLGCTQNWFYLGNNFTESDTRLNDQVPWVNGAASGKIDIETIAVHEIGHSMGLGDLSCAGVSNVMESGCDASYFYNSIAHRSLGLGDALGNNAKY